MKNFCFIFIILASCTSTQDNNQLPENSISTVISNVNIINVRDGSIDSARYVTVESGVIVNIFTEAQPWGKEVQIIDGKDKYLMPGLAEMHAHIPSLKNGREYIDQTLFLYLSNGVTTIRGMLGHPIHLELREQAKKNEILSPRIYTSSPSLNGNSVETPEEARKKITDYVNAGYDFLKLHPGIKDDVFDEIVAASLEMDITFSGHVSVDVGIRKAIKSNYASIDHVDGYLEGLVPESANVVPNENGFFGYNFTSLADTSKIKELVTLSRENKVWVVPTQSLFDRWFSPEDPLKLAAEDEMRYIWKSTLDQWIESKKRITGGETYSEEQWLTFNSIRNALIHDLQKSGHGLVLGSDAPQVFNVPGFSIHHELESMQKAGLTPLEALQTGTINSAAFFGEEGNYGEIIEGSSADLILLKGNPLKDLTHLKNPEGVMVRGKWLSKIFIKKELDKIAEQAKTL